MAQNATFDESNGTGTLRDLVEGLCSSPRAVLATIEAEHSPLIGDLGEGHGLFDRDSLARYVATRYRGFEAAPRCFSEAKSILDATQHEGSVVRCTDGMPHPFVFQGETGKTSVVKMLGITDQMLDLPLPMALLPGRCLIMPEGYSWHFVRTDASSDFVLSGPDASLKAMVGEDYRESGARVVSLRSGEGLWVSRLSLDHLANLGEALAYAECETCDERGLAPHDRRGDGEAMGLLFRHCCTKASRSIWGGFVSFGGRDKGPAGFPFEQALASQYAASYAECDRVRDALCTRYLDSGCSVRLSQLIDECAMGHAAEDLDRIQDAFEERGLTRARINERASEREVGNAPLSQCRVAATDALGRGDAARDRPFER